MPLGFAVAHYDEPPGDRLRDLDELREADAFREANELRAWIEVEGGEIVAHGRDGRGVVAGVGLELGPDQVAFPAVEFPVIRPGARGRGRLACASPRPSAAASASPRRGRCRASRTSTSARRSPGRRSSSSCAPTAAPRGGSSRPARSRATRSTTRTAG